MCWQRHQTAQPARQYLRGTAYPALALRCPCAGATTARTLAGAHGRTVSQMRVNAACQSCCGSVTMSLGKVYRSYNCVTMASHAWYSLTTASWPCRWYHHQ
jgi:hypothetical protein